MKNTWVRGLFVSFVLLAQTVLAAPAPLKLEHSLDIKAFKGKTFLEAMIANEGIKANFDEDFQSTYTIPEAKVVLKALKNFDGKVVKKVLKSFDNGEEGLRELAESLEGQTFKPSNIIGKVRGHLGQGGDFYSVAQLFAMASGAGTLVTIDSENYYYNYGYKSGENPDDVKTGRSFGAGPEHAANDASDIMYLNELETYLGEASNPRAFYKALLDVLLNCDPRGFKSQELSSLGRTVATDFMAIYTAESDRHVMVNLVPAKHPWENDLAEATFVSAFGVAVGKVMKDGALADGNAREWWAKSQISNRSGIGNTRKDRRKLQQLITDYERTNHPELVEAVEVLIEVKNRKGDIFQGLMEHLNHFDTQDSVRENAKDISEAFVDFLMQVRKDAKKIAAEIQ